MAVTPFNFLLLHLGWSQIPSSFAFSIGSQAMIGGAGVLGYGGVQDMAALSGPFATAGNPVPTAKKLQGGIVGVAYTETVAAQGGTAPYTFAVIAGSLPAGLSLASSTGIISGTPTTVGTYDLTIQATDSTGATGQTDFEISVTAPSSGGQVAYAFVG